MLCYTSVHLLEVPLGLLPPPVDLDVGLGEGDHLGQDLRHVQVVHLVPLPRPAVQGVHLKNNYFTFWSIIIYG